MPRVWELVCELADYERLMDAVTGDAASLTRHAIDDRRVDVMVAEVDGLVVGYTISFPTYSTFRTRPGIWMEDLYVTPAFRGQGIGRDLLQAMMRRCEAEGAGRLEWSVLDWNESAIRFYEAMGATLLPDWRVCRISYGLNEETPGPS